MKELINWIKDLSAKPLIKVSYFDLTLSDVVFLLLGLLLLFKGADRIKLWLVNRVLARYKIDLGIRQSVAALIRYGFILIGLLILLPFVGINLTTFGVIAGTLGLGIGFGLQNIIKDFVSGWVMLFERSVKAGDRITVGDISGNVSVIASRATTMVNNDNLAVIVPNSKLIDENLVNWNYNGGAVRLKFKIHVCADEDPEQVRLLLFDVINSESGIIKHPAPEVLLDNFEDGIITFVLRVWTSKFINKPPVLRNRLNSAISKKFKEHNITIPFPQLDIRWFGIGAKI